jgi:hypothetical protein
LDLARAGAGTDDEIVGKRRYPGKVKDVDIAGFFGFGGADSYQPGGLLNFLTQKLSLLVSYYN